MADDPREKLRRGQRASDSCEVVAEKENQKNLILGDTSNVNSDWTDNVFEFKWK